MSNRAWVFAVAIGGFLVIFGWSGLALTDSPKDQGTSKGNPAQSSAARDKAKSGQSDATAPTPETVSVDQEARSGESKEASRPEDYYQKEDLKAQQGMARATDSIVSLTRVQIVLGISGTVLLLWTLYETRRATNLASSTAQRELRAYLGIEAANINFIEKGQNPNIVITIRNFGQTPAHDIRHVLCRYAMVPGEECFDVSPDDSGKETEGDMSPGQSILPRTTITRFEWAFWHRAVKSGAATLYVWGQIKYRDAFDIERETTYRFHLNRDDGGLISGPLGVCTEGNKIT